MRFHLKISRIRFIVMTRLALVVIGLCCGPMVALGDDAMPAWKDLLSRRVIAPDLPLKEVQEFTEQRVLPMPQLKSPQQWTQYADRLRAQVLDDVVFRGAAAEWRLTKTKPVWLDVIEADGYRIRKLRFECVPGMWVPALLYEPAKIEGRIPVVLNVNGHDRGSGKAAEYKQIRCINQVRRGMLALNVEWLGMGQLNSPGFGHYKMNQLDLCGTSGLAPFYLTMSRGLDVLLSHPHSDPDRVAVAGLSGGGWQTIFISALDRRVTLANPVAGYSSFRTRARFLSDLGDSEQTPSDLATLVDYTHLTALRAPRPTLLTYNAEDQCCFRAEHALPPLIEAAAPVYELFGKRSALRTHVNHDPGTHNFDRDNREQLTRMLGDFFFENSTNLSVTEIECGDELRSADELRVALPEPNVDFHALASQLSAQLKERQQADTAGPITGQRAEMLRQTLRTVTKFHEWTTRGIVERTEDREDIVVVSWWLRVGESWTVPGVEVRPAKQEPSRTVIVLGDAGRGALVTVVQKHLERGHRVLAIDPFYFGESKISQRDFLFALLVAAVGERPLGIQSSQIASIADWSQQAWSVPVDVEAHGPRLSLATEIAAAVAHETIANATVHRALSTLHSVIDRDRAVNETPELFCFGLLQSCDIPMIELLIGTDRLTRKD